MWRFAAASARLAHSISVACHVRKRERKRGGGGEREREEGGGGRNSLHISGGGSIQGRTHTRLLQTDFM